MPAKAATQKSNEEMVLLELNPAGGVDVLGDGDPPLLTRNAPSEFTRAEADALLKLRNEHGTPLVRIVEGA